MKKSLIFFVMFLVFEAQGKSKFDVYAELGLSKSFAYGFYESTDFRKFNLPFVGLKCRGKFNKFLMFETGMQFIPMHDHYYRQSSSFSLLSKETITTSYQRKSDLTKLSIPLTLRYQFKKLRLKPEFSFGLIYNRMLSANYIEITNSRGNVSSKNDYNDTFRLDPLNKSYYKPLNKNFFQLHVGIGLQMSKNFRLSLSASNSINGDGYVVPSKPMGWTCFVPGAMFYRSEILLSLMYKIN